MFQHQAVVDMVWVEVMDSFLPTGPQDIGWAVLLGYHSSEGRRPDANLFNTFRPRQNCCDFMNDIFECIFLNENVWIMIKMSLEFVPKGQIHNIPAMVQIMTWCHPGDKPLSDPMMVSLLTQLCVTRPRWVNAGIASECKLGFVNLDY